MRPRLAIPRRFELRVPAEEHHLAAIRDFIQEAGEKLLVPGKILANTKLAVDEACTNVVKHGYKGRPGSIEVVVTGNGREFSIEIRDQGERFDLRNVKSPDLKLYVETRRRGGLGVFLMNQLMDEVRYRAGQDGNELTMSKRLDRVRRRRGRGRPRRSLRFVYTVQAFGVLAVLVGAAFGAIFVRQSDAVRDELVAQARASAQNLAAPASALLADPVPMSLEQTRLNQSMRSVARSHPEIEAARILDAKGRVWASHRFEEIFTVRDLKAPAGLARRRVLEPVRGPAPRASAAPPPGPLGWVEMVIHERAIVDRIDRVRNELSAIALSTLVFGFALTAILIAVFVRPIQALSESVRAIGDGDILAEIGNSGNEEIDDIARAFNEVTAKFRAAQGHLMEQERLRKEMQVAQEIQQTLLPRRVPDLEGFEIGYIYQAAKEVGGDYFDFLSVDERTVGVVVADVSGKGVPGSLVMTMIRTALRMEARGNRSASDVMAKMNAFVTEDMKKGMFVTMFYVVLDSVNRVVSYASAGHNPMILYRGESRATYFLKPKGIPVGINVPDEALFKRTIGVERLTLQKDDMLVMYTDGITEAMNPSREQFGEARLLAAIKRQGHLTSQEFADALSHEIKEFTGGAPQNDDITLVAIKERVAVAQRIEERRRELVRLVDVEGVSVADACAQLHVSPSSYYRMRRLVDLHGEAAFRGRRPGSGMARASLEEEAAILAIVRADPLLGAKRILGRLRATSGCREEISVRSVYEALRRHALNTKEKRLEFAQSNSDNRMARLARALLEPVPHDAAADGGGAA